MILLVFLVKLVYSDAYWFNLVFFGYSYYNICIELNCTNNVSDLYIDVQIWQDKEPCLDSFFRKNNININIVLSHSEHNH